MLVIYAEKADVGKKIAAAIDGITLGTGKKVSFSELDTYKTQIGKQQSENSKEKTASSKLTISARMNVLSLGVGGICMG